MYILGINAYHAGASACLLADGELVAAAEEERFRRIKYCAGFPTEAIRYCLAEAGIDAYALDHVGMARRPLQQCHSARAPGSDGRWNQPGAIRGESACLRC